MNIQLPDSQKPECLNKEIVCPQTNLQKLTTQVKRIGKLIEKILSRQPKFEITHQKSGAGNELWKVYDASTGRTVYLTSEEEVRVWIEESFYHRHQESKPINNLDLYQQRRFY